MKHLLNLLAAVALLVWGTQLVRTGILRVFGARLRQMIARSVRTPGAAFDDVILYQDAAQRGRADGEVMALAAGGIAAAFAALLNAELVSGSAYYLHYSGFNKLLSHCAWVITGEGHLDKQSLYGKIPGVIAKICKQNKVNLLAVCGSAESGIEDFNRIFELVSYAPSTTEAILHPELYFPAICQEIKNYLFACPPS